MSEQHLPELAADRQADLETKIGHLEKDAASIPGMADYYAGFARDFRQEQANLTGDEREAHGHDYAGSLARIVGQHRAERGDTDNAALLEKEADTRFQIAADLRSQPSAEASDYQDWKRDTLDSDEAKHLATMETAAEQQQDPAFAHAITDDEIEAAPSIAPQGKNWLETAAENVREMNAEAQGKTLDEAALVVADTMKDASSYVALDRQAPDTDADNPRDRALANLASDLAEVQFATASEIEGWDKSQGRDLAFFRGEQAELSGNAKLGHAHEYVAVLAETLSEHFGHSNQPAKATHYAELGAAHGDAAQFLGWNRDPEPEVDRQAPEGDPDPDKPRGGKPSPDMPSGPSEGRNYDALKSSHNDTQAILDEEERRKGNAPPVAAIEGPTRPSHIRATMAAEPAPDGTKSSRSTYYDPNDNPALGDVKTALAEPRPMHPDDHAARFSEDLSAVASARIVQGDAPAARDFVGSAREQMAAELHGIAVEISPASRQMFEESTKRQDGERLAAAGETPDRTDTPMSARERVTLELKEIAAEIAGRDGQDMGRSASASRGMGM